MKIPTLIVTTWLILVVVISCVSYELVNDKAKFLTGCKQAMKGYECLLAWCQAGGK